MRLNKKGAALLQVLVLSALIATIVVVLLKFSITRAANALQTKHTLQTKIAIQSCLNLLSEEDSVRISQGQVPYLYENNSYTCDINNYSVKITPVTDTNDTTQDLATGKVRKLNFEVTFY